MHAVYCAKILWFGKMKEGQRLLLRSPSMYIKTPFVIGMYFAYGASKDFTLLVTVTPPSYNAVMAK